MLCLRASKQKSLSYLLSLPRTLANVPLPSRLTATPKPSRGSTKKLLGSNEWSAKDKSLVVNWARQSLKGAEYNRYKADKAGWSQEVKAKLSKKINRLRELIETLTGELWQ